MCMDFRGQSLKTNVKNDIFWSEIGSGLGVTGQHTPTKDSEDYLRDLNEEITVEPRYNEGPRD